jgi:FtsZ-interacting cell division protein ZipA
MTPLAIGPVLALLGIVAAFFVLRRKAKTRKSMYRTLRERREVDLRKARERATTAKGAVERTAMEREAAAQAAAAAAAAPSAGPASAATLPTSAQDAPSAYAPPAPSYTPQEPTYTAPEPLPEPPPAPIEQAPAEVLPAPPPTAGDQTRPAWEIVQPDKPEAEDVHAAGAGSAGPGKASWELAPGEQERIDDRRKGRGRHDDDEEEDGTGEESLAQVLLSYAGLVAALLVILFGIFLMIGGRGHN